MPGFANLGHDQLQAVFEYVYYGKETTVKDNGPSPLDAKYISDGYNKFLDKDGYPAIQPPWGTLTAIDLNSGKTAWKIPLGEYPELAAQGLTGTGSENYGGAGGDRGRPAVYWRYQLRQSFSCLGQGHRQGAMANDAAGGRKCDPFYL